MIDETLNNPAPGSDTERQAVINAAADAVLDENMEAFLELAK